MTLDEAKELFPEVSIEKPENAIGYIYVTINVDKQKFYIGKWASKWKECYYGGGHYPKLWKKENDNLEHWPIQWCYTKEELDIAEYMWIDMFKGDLDLANLTEGGNKHKPITDEISENKKEYFKNNTNGFKGGSHSDIARQKISEANYTYQQINDNQFLGHSHTKETKELISKIAKEYHENPTVKRRYSEATKKYLEEHDNPFKGKSHTESTKEIMSKKAKERMNDTKYRYRNAKKVLCIETGEIFNSVTDAAKAFGHKNASHISAVCKDKRKTAYGKHWTYYDEDNDKEIKNQLKTINYTKIRCVETGELFNTASEINKKFNTRHSTILAVCRGEVNSCFGMHWEFVPVTEIIVEENSEPSPLPDYSYSNELGFLERKTCLA